MAKRGDKERRKPKRDASKVLARALAAEEGGDVDVVESSYREALRLAPHSPDVLHLAGVFARKRGNLEKSASLLGRAVAARDEDPRHHNALGITQMLAGWREDACESFTRALARDPDHVEARYNLAALLEDAGASDRAEEEYRRVIALAPGLAAAHYNLGGLLLGLGRPDEAVECYRAALEARPDYPAALSNLGIALRAAGRLGEAEVELRRAVERDPDSPAAWNNLGLVCSDRGDDAGALAAYRRAIEIDPEHPNARHMLHALTDTRTARAPEAYVARLFDDYSERFEASLLGELQYAVPAALRRLLDARRGERCFSRALDLGCGTGLFGLELRPVAERLAGVDLSPKMIEQARHKRIYDELWVGDVERFLAEREQSFDLVGAADVLVYLGDLEPVLSAVARRLEPGGVFLFSVERLDGDGDYVLRPTGRYAHAPAYVEGLAARHDLGASSERRMLRRQRGEPIDGMLYLLAAPATP